VNKQEKAALLAESEKTLEMMESLFDKFLREGSGDLAWNAWNKYSGAVVMLERLGLISANDSIDRSNALFERYMAAAFPKEVV